MMWPRLISTAVVLAVLVGAGWYIDSAGYDRGVAAVRQEVQVVADAADAKNAEIHRKQIQTLMEAHDAKDKRLQTVADDHARALRELDGLRLAARASSGGAVPSASASAGADDTNTVADLLGLCGAELVRVARAADGHAADALMLQQAWPR